MARSRIASRAESVLKLMLNQAVFCKSAGVGLIGVDPGFELVHL